MMPPGLRECTEAEVPCFEHEDVVEKEEQGTLRVMVQSTGVWYEGRVRRMKGVVAIYDGRLIR